MKEDWFQQWLERDKYLFWYEYRDNEVFRNGKYVIVWHPAVGLRIMVPEDYYSEGYLCKVFIPQTLAKQEE